MNEDIEQQETLQDEYQDEYRAGYEAGFEACNKRYIAILARFPMQCAMISRRLPLHSTQPDSILERDSNV